MIRILLADDQALVRAGFRALLDAQEDMKVVGEAANGEEAVKLANDSPYGLSGSVFGEREHAEQVARRVDSRAHSPDGAAAARPPPPGSRAHGQRQGALRRAPAVMRPGSGL